MKIKKLMTVLLSPDIFKAVFFGVTILGVCPLVIGSIEPFLKLFHIYALAVILFDLIGEKRILRNKGRILLVLFGLCYAGTLMTNINLISFSGLSNFCYLLATLALVYSYGKNSFRRDHISVTVLCALITLANVVGIWMFFVKFFYYVPERGYIGMYPSENRLAGLFGNPNVLGFVSLGIICLCVIQLFISVCRWEKVGFAVMAGINLLALLLANSRTQIYSLVFMSAILTFMLVLKPHADVKRVLLATGVAGLCAVLVFCGFKMVQRGISQFDVNYDYYAENINNISAGQLLEQKKPILAIKKNNADESTTESIKNDESTTESIKNDESTTESIIITDEAITEQINNSNHLQTIIREDTVDDELNGRLELWRNGLRIILAKPIFGCGLDNHNNVLLELGYSELPVKGNLHNVYLDILACCGIAGFLCLILFLLIMLVEVIQFFKYNDGKTWALGAVMLACIAAFLLDGMADSTLIASFYPTAIVFWFITSEFAGVMEEEALRTGHYSKGVLCNVTEKLCLHMKK